MGAERESLNLRVDGLDCPDCAVTLERAVKALPGVASAELAYATSKLVVVTEGDDQVMPDIQRVAESMGYQVASAAGGVVPEVTGLFHWLRRRRRDVGTAVGGLLMLVALALHLLGVPENLSNILYGLATLAGGFYVARAAWVGLRTAHSLDMNVLMTVAAIGAMFVGEFAEGAVTIFLFSVGELLEAYSGDRARQAIHRLMELAPNQAALLPRGKESTGDDEVRVPVSALQVGDLILVRPGERIPMDGRIVEGDSAINQAPITGESMPVEKIVGDEVFAGTINGNGALVVEVTRWAHDNAIARIIRLVEEAQSQRAPAQRFVDRFARVYTPIVVILAVLIAVVPPVLGLGAMRDWVYRALVLLVISCPCALVISTPITIVSALARAARSGVLIKGGRYLEDIASLRVIAFDKTGTITTGKPYVMGSACESHPEIWEKCTTCLDLIAKAAAVEQRSEHALAQAVIQQARELGVEGRYPSADGVTAVTGMGVQGLVDGHSVYVGSHKFCHRDGASSAPLCEAIGEAESKGYTVLVVEDSSSGRRCYLAVSDSLREGAHEVIKELKRVGIERTVMVTGDNPHVAARIAEQAGIDDVYAELLPDDKVRLMRKLEEECGSVAMVGDGVNDAPAMARATVGIAMGAAGTDAALEVADVALMGDDLSRLPFVIRLSRRAMHVVRSNIFISLLTKAVFLGLAIGGVSTLWMAVLADMGTSLAVSLNGLRLLSFRDRTTGQGT